MRIYEYMLERGAAECEVWLPVAARVLGVSRRTDTGTLYVIAQVAGKQKGGTDRRRFVVIPSGADFDERLKLYVGSVEYRADWVHVFEDVRNREE